MNTDGCNTPGGGVKVFVREICPGAGVPDPLEGAYRFWGGAGALAEYPLLWLTGESSTANSSSSRGTSIAAEIDIDLAVPGLEECME